MRVGIVLNSFNATVGGGYTFQESVLSALPDLVADSDHQFFVFSYGLLDFYKNNPKFSQMNFIQIKPPSSRYQSTQRRVTKLINLIFNTKRPLPSYGLESYLIEHEVEVVWFVSGGWWQPLDIPYIATVWDLMHLSHPIFPEVSSKGEWQKREEVLGNFIKRATAIITGTIVGRKEIESFYGIPEDRVHIIPHPTPQFSLNINEIHSDVLSKFGITGKYLLYPAQFWPHKNHIGLLHVMKCLIDLGSDDFSLVFVGADQGNQDFVRETATKLGVSHKVFFLGFVTTEELVYLYQHAFALTYLSFCGPENLPPLEAFSLKCPVIASAIDGAIEQLGDAAILVDPLNPEAIARQIIALEANQSMRFSLIDKGSLRALRWTSRDYVRKVISILNDVSIIRACWPAK